LYFGAMATPSGTDLTEDAAPPAAPRIRVLELFAGIGGMRLALAYAGIDVEALAVEVNELALRLYGRNFGSSGVAARDLRSLSVAWFERQACPVWTMSPPCQPYTRQGRLRDAEDPRAQPLLHVIEVLEAMREPPEAIVLENVQNFERSESCARLLAVLRRRGYDWRSFLLTPRQFGFPNARSRFYLVAKKKIWPFDFVPASSVEDAGAVCQPWSLLPCMEAAQGGRGWAADELGRAPACDLTADGAAEHVDQENEFTCPACNRDVPEARHLGTGSHACSYQTPMVAHFLDGEDGETGTAEDPDIGGEEGQAAESSRASSSWLVPEVVMQKESARCFDAVHRACRHSLCFTKAYGRYINGTGSVYQMARRLAEPSPEAGEYTMREFFGALRYFTPREVARLLGFKLRGPGAPPCSNGCLPACSRHVPASAPRGAEAPGGAAETSSLGWPCCCPPFDLPSGPAAAESARELWALLGNSLNPQVVALVCHLCQLAGRAASEPPARIDGEGVSVERM